MKLQAALQFLLLVLAAPRGSATDTEAWPAERSLRGNAKEIRPGARDVRAVVYTQEEAGAHRVLVDGPNGTPGFIKGKFGVIHGLGTASDKAAKQWAKEILESVLAKHYGASSTGRDRVYPVRMNRDKRGGTHVRFSQEIDGKSVEGAALVLHINADGTVYAVNGEYVKAENVASDPSIAPEACIEEAIRQSGVPSDAACVDDVALGVVRGDEDGKGYLAYRCLVQYDKETSTGPVLQRDVVFCDAMNGNLVARHPKIYAARALATYDCSSKTRCSLVVTTSPNPISTGDPAIDSAHNYAIATYNYYLNNHGRDSIDDAGMTLKSRVHYRRNYNNAFWDGSQMTYGDGDGVTFIPFSRDADVVAHEITHGVTERSSGLIYQNESGALNEALSDIFGAMVDIQEGATGAARWLVGEDIYTPGTSGDGLRNMADPAEAGDYDWYPTRYTGTEDNGGVHSNSGIANLAFVLLSDGGSHPQYKSTVTVPSIGTAAAADIFYMSNVACLTPSSNFETARWCTADVHGGVNTEAVHAAWDAVGVPNNQLPPPQPPINLTDGQSLSGQSGDTGVVQQYTLSVSSGDTVTCATACNNGDADLYLRFGAEAVPDSRSSVNECGSYSLNSNEQCATGSAPGDTTLYAAVHAYKAYTDLTITCTISGGGVCSPSGTACSSGSECCSDKCKGMPGRKSCA